MKSKKQMRTTVLTAVLCLVLATGALADVLGELIGGHDTYLGAGMELSKGVYWTGSDYQTENYIEYTPGTTVYPVVVSGSKLTNYGSFSSMAALLEKQGKHVVAGINGDYFVVANYEPLGIVVQNGELLSSDVGHFAVGFRADGSAVFGKPALQITLTINGQAFSLDSINKTRTDGGAAFYTDFYASGTKNKGEGTDVILSMDGPLSVNCTRTLTAEETLTAGGAATIPIGKTVLSISTNATDALKEAVATLTAGATATLSISSPPEWSDVTYALGSLYKLVTNGVAESAFPADGVNPRTAVGKKADGTLVFYTLDGRQSGLSVGVTMTKLAQRMVELGCVEASIMDGGGSTSLNAIYLGDSSASQINDPSGGYQRSVTNYIMLVTEAQPTGKATRLALYPLSTSILSGATSSFTVKAADDNGYPVAVNSSVSLSTDSALGIIAADGVFKATGAGSGNVTAAGEGLVSAAVQVNVVKTPDSVILKKEGGGAVSSLSVSTDSTTALTASAIKNHVNLISQDDCFTWSVQGDIGMISADGTFTAGSQNATGAITVAAGEKLVSIPVTVTNPEKYDDVAKGDWFYDAVKYVTEANMMNGVAERTFAPGSDTSRAMTVTVLWRLQGSPEPTVSGAFSDVPDGQWYSKAVYWASEKGIVEGYAGKFDPLTAVTREQLAAILYRYSGSPGTNGSLVKYTDVTSVSSWAVTALSWTTETGLIGGMTDMLLSPKTTATRAQLATIFNRMR